MSKYEQRISEFAEGKQLVRLAQPLRDRADVACDACGSVQPRRLFALKDESSERYYFVGYNCLKQLMGLNVVRKRFCRESASAAWESEIAQRNDYIEDPSRVGLQSSDDSADSHPPPRCGIGIPVVFLISTKPLCPSRIRMATSGRGATRGGPERQYGSPGREMSKDTQPRWWSMTLGLLKHACETLGRIVPEERQRIRSMTR